MSDFYKYSDIELIYKVPEIFISLVVVQEKVHGTNVRFGIYHNRFYVGGHNLVFMILKENDTPPPVGQLPTNDFGFTKWIIDNNLHVKTRELFKDKEIIFHGEWLGKGIQKGFNYCENKQFWCFDVRVDGEILSWEKAEKYIDELVINKMPVFYVGAIDQNMLSEFLTYKSKVAESNGILNEEIEGVVIKPLIPKRDHRGHQLMAKFKTKKASETKTGKKNPPSP